MVILLLRNSFFLLFLGWDGLGVTSFILVNFFKNWNTLNNRILTFIRNRIGDVLLLLLLRNFIINLNLKTIYIWRFIIIFIRLTKRAQFPFMSWLPAAIAAPTPVSALVHSSTLVTAGIFVLLIIKNYLRYLNLKFIFLISFITIFISGVRAILESDFKKIVAFSTLSQIGFLFFIVRNFKFSLCFFHLFSHAFFKRILFISVGSILHSSNRNQERRRNLKNKNTNLISNLILNIRILNLMGLFYRSGFWRKDLFLIFFINNYKIFIRIFFIFLVILTISYSLKIIFFIINFNLKFWKQNRILLINSYFFLMGLSLLFSLYFYENYLYFYENYLYFYENYLYLIFLLLFFINFNYFLKIINKIFYFIGGLIFLNNFLTFIFNNIFSIFEKKLIDRNIFFIKNLILKNYFNYFFIVILIFVLII